MTIMIDRPTETMKASSGGEASKAGSFEELCRLLPELHVPDGYRAEIIRGSIVVSPWSQGYYAPIIWAICEHLQPFAPEGHKAASTPYLFTFPASERAYGPDVYVADASAFRTRSRYIEGEALSLVAELTSIATRANDLSDKAEVYGKSGVPVYLLLDMQNETTTVFWTPSSRGYVSHLTVPFGEKVHIPAPFDCELDTASFAAPEDESES
ncbi:Uma2 family endonuclease [Streptomyces cuspidosporus]|uniref:Uma2 family endonuclease n=2 Tax=Streptomyces cuspidosporus TaxID=66882 RepID=A0ABN3FQ77_9ACTN